MSDLPAVIESGAVQSATVTEPTNLELSASTPQEMKQVQSNLILWAERKLRSLAVDADDLHASYEHAKKNKWKTTTLYNHWRKQVRLIEYYQKMLAAFQQGYILVPNFPIDLFAVRTNKESPNEYYGFERWADRSHKVEALPKGEGEYVSPTTTILDSSEEVKNPQTGLMADKPVYWASEFQEIDFPINMAKPHIMEATKFAMDLKIFDAIGVLPSAKRKVDPLICGQIIRVSRPIWALTVTTYLIGWHIDTRTL